MKHSERCICHICVPLYRGYPQSTSDKKHPWIEGVILKFTSTYLADDQLWYVDADVYLNNFAHRTEMSGRDWNNLEDVENEQ